MSAIFDETNMRHILGKYISDAEEVEEVTSGILFMDIGTRFALDQITSCEVKSYFKLMFPKLGGLGGRMPHHAGYRDRIIEQLDRK